MRPRALHLILALVVTAGLAACAPPAETTAPAESAPAVDLAAEEQAIRDSSMQWLAAHQDRDLLTMLSFMDANAVFILDGQVLRGRAAVEDAAQEQWEANPDAAVEWATGSVQLAASGDMAYELGSFTMDPGGLANPDAVTGEYVTVWRKIDGEWKAVVDAGTTIRDAAGG